MARIIRNKNAPRIKIYDLVTSNGIDKKISKMLSEKQKKLNKINKKTRHPKRTGEIKSAIKQTEFRKGFYIEVNCPYCGIETSFGADTKKELSQTLKDNGWKWLNSDMYGQVGYWCGCNYKD